MPASVIYWFRNDLRITDNVGLAAANREHENVVPVYIIDPETIRGMGAPRAAFQLDSLKALQKAIEKAGGRLIIRQGNAWDELKKLGEESGARAIFFNRDYEPEARTRDAAIEKQARALGWDVRVFKDDVIHEADEVLKSDGTPYVVFTPYSKAWRALPLPEVIPAVTFRSTVPAKIKSVPLPTATELGFTLEAEIPVGGEAEARKMLQRFMDDPILEYRRERDFPALEGTSRLSPHLRAGTISARTVVAAAEAVRKERPKAGGIETFVSEIIWREFYRQVLWHFPHAAKSCFRPQYDALKWENNEKHFAAWCAGRTGFPIVDAAMRQLNTTGWMHNRLRMIVAMFLTKDLLVSWQWGERYFMQKLVDADLASNNGGWQWSAGTGTDAAPYFRIFNPNSQAAKFDPEGRFIAKYVPEADSASYPAPIVNHAEQRVKALAMYKG